MASTGKKSWSGMDVALCQELCGSRPKQRVPQTGEKRERTSAHLQVAPGCAGHTMKADATSRGSHVCEVCRGNHPKCLCGARPGKA